MKVGRGNGEVVTFYSYKGGTGRTMALANIACLLARRQAAPVLMIDWDLEAPGLHRFFSDRLASRGRRVTIAGLEHQPGVIDLFVNLRDTLQAMGSGEQTETEARTLLDSVDLQQYYLKTGEDSLFLLTAGAFDEDYATRVNSFQWEALYSRSPWMIKALAEVLSSQFRYILVDSRTGITDSSGICTTLMPEKLVVVFTPTQQSLTGVSDLVRTATAYRRKSDDLRPLAVFPLPSRVDLSEEALRSHWRYGSQDEGLVGYEPLFEDLFKDVYDLSECNLQSYFDEVQIQYVSDYSYGEKIAVLLQEPDDRLSLARSYDGFVSKLIGLSVPWEGEAGSIRAFVALPSAQQFIPIAERLRTALVSRGIDIQQPRLVEQQFFLESFLEAMREADFCIADLTGGNADVLAELGMMLVLEKPLILLRERGDDSPLPLGIKEHQLFQYDPDTLLVWNRISQKFRALEDIIDEQVAVLPVQKRRRQDVEIPSQRELEWLRMLARGATVAQIADATGYSERAMFRLLRSLYSQMNAKNRTEALIIAQQRGWL